MTRVAVLTWMITLCGLFSAAVSAQDRPPKHSSFTPTIVADRGLPSDVEIFAEEEIGYNDQGDWSTYSLCESDVDPVHGACAVAPEATLPSPIRLRFTERRTRLTVDVTAEATRSEKGDFGSPQYFGMTDDSWRNITRLTMRLTVKVPASEIRKFPVGGIWDASLRLNVHVNAKQPSQVLWQAAITAHITDEQQIAIYMPQFGGANPSADLNLTRRSAGSTPGAMMTGHQVVDACLYDGYNTQSDRYEITMTDLGSTGGGGFAVRHTGAVSPGLDGFVEYTVSAPDPATGIAHAFTSGVPETFPGANTGAIRYVRMPFSPYPVVCTPWPITLDTPAFNSSAKQAGVYSGALEIIFKPSTSAP